MRCKTKGLWSVGASEENEAPVRGDFALDHLNLSLNWQETARREQTKWNFKGIFLISPAEHLSPGSLTGLQSGCDREKHYASSVLSFHHSDSSHNFCEQ